MCYTKTDQPKTDLPKTDQPKPDLPKTDQPKIDLPKTDQPTDCMTMKLLRYHLPKGTTTQKIFSQF